METKYKTEATERKAPDMSVCVHVDDSARISVMSSGDDGASISINGWSYPSLTVFLTREKLAEMRDVITAYLEAGE